MTYGDVHRSQDYLWIFLVFTGYLRKREEECRRALKQNEEKHYEEELLVGGYKAIRQCGICFCKKNCMVKIE
ncbi:MAG: hypothetical protein K2N15_13960 [Lachnospiraceae bacterium]|nr:hypothetical protein [Lachnospiraceae bacterium]